MSQHLTPVLLMALVAVCAATVPVLKVVPEVVSQPQSQDKPERVFQFIEDDDDFMVEESLRNRRTIVDGYQCRGEDPFLFIGERLPPITDFAAVGDLREFILPDTPAFEALANNNNEDIDFLGGANSQVMTTRMSAKLNTLAALVENKFTGADLVVLSAYLERPENNPSQFVPEALQYAGRMLVLTTKSEQAGTVSRHQCNAAQLAELAFEAHMDWMTIEFDEDIGGYVLRVATVPDGCGADLDLAFLLDGSGSVGLSGWNDQLQFVEEMLNEYELGPSKTRVGIVAAHGPRIAHYSFNSSIPDCPPGTFFSLLGCVCESGSSCDGPGVSPGNPVGCNVGFFATEEGGCDGVTTDEQCAEAPNCECTRRFYTHDCDTCQCTVLGEQFNKESSFDVIYRFTFTPSLEGVRQELALDNYAYPDGATHISLALEALNMQVFSTRTGMRPASAGIPRVLVTLTDGKSNPGFEPKEIADQLKAKDVTLFSICLGECFEPELQDLAEDDRHIFHVANPDSLETIVDRLAYQTCETPGGVDPGGNETEGGVGNGEFQYFQVECDALARFITVELIDLVGKSSLYVSRTTTNPSPLNNDGERLFDETTKRITIDRQTNNGILRDVHIGVQGSNVAQTNTFDLRVTQNIFEQSNRILSILDDANGVVVADAVLAPIPGYTPDYDFELEDDFDGLFSVGETGAISVTRALPDGVSEFQLVLIGVDSVTPCLTGSQNIIIGVTRQSDRIPTFSQTDYPVTFAEDVNVGSRRRAVGDSVTVEASTVAQGVTIVFSIVDGNDNGFFNIQPVQGSATSAVVTQVAPIDFEALGGNNVIVLTIEARDSLAQTGTTATVTITVSDANDPPVIDLPDDVQNVTIAANADTDTLVFFAPVTDPDSNDITFSCALEGSNLVTAMFDVATSSTGCRVTTAVDLTSGDTPFFTVVVTDDNFQNLRETVDVQVTVVTPNQFDPTFDQTSYSSNVALNSPVDTVVVTAGVSDADRDETDVPLSCSFGVGNEEGLLAFTSDNDLTRTSCQVITTRTIDLDVDSLVVILLVSDGERETSRLLEINFFSGCNPQPCETGFACPPQGSEECDCVEGTRQQDGTCDIDFCAAEPCENDGECTNQDDTRSCTCQPGTSGVDCQDVTNICDGVQCLNGGSCQRISNLTSGELNSFVCQCQRFFFGTFCGEQDTSDNACDDMPCVSGTCERTRDTPDGPENNYTCTCPTNVIGRNCDQCPEGLFGRDDSTMPPTFCTETKSDVDICEGARCLNGGTCTPTQSAPFSDLDDFICTCPAGFGGEICDETSTRCANLNCRNGGECVPSQRGGECRCIDGFSGPTCSTPPRNLAQSSESDNTAALAGGVVAGVVVLLILIAIIALVLARGRRDKVVKPVYADTSRHDNPTFVAPGAASGGPDGLSNPMYGAGAYPDSNYNAAPGAAMYDSVGGPTTGYDVVAPPQGAVYDTAQPLNQQVPHSADGGYFAVNTGRGGDAGMTSAQNPMYFTGSAGGGDPMYDQASATPIGNERNLTIERGRLRLASVSRANPLANGIGNPMYAQGAAAEPAYDTASASPVYDNNTPGYLEITGESSS